jgi:asparagine synthase (glutamine-hydrolysing)
VPFLDRELVEYALALPEEARRPAARPKRYLVEAVGDLLPELVADRRKSGFAMPFDRWIRGPLQPFCEEGLRALAAHETFQGEVVRHIWRAFLAADSRVPWSRPWLLVALGHWIEREGIT